MNMKTLFLKPGVVEGNRHLTGTVRMLWVQSEIMETFFGIRDHDFLSICCSLLQQRIMAFYKK